MIIILSFLLCYTCNKQAVCPLDWDMGPPPSSGSLGLIQTFGGWLVDNAIKLTDFKHEKTQFWHLDLLNKPPVTITDLKGFR